MRRVVPSSQAGLVTAARSTEHVCCYVARPANTTETNDSCRTEMRKSSFDLREETKLEDKVLCERVAFVGRTFLHNGSDQGRAINYLGSRYQIVSWA